jgi:nucleotide-binding universal stress UspA family protein
MSAIQSVLCPVDFSPATERQLELAGDLARAFGARLVLHHNLDSAPPGAAVGWMWAKEHHDKSPETICEQRLGELLSGLPEGVDSEARITQGLPFPSVLAVAETVAADLVVLACHGESREDHASMTEQLLDQGRRAVLALHDSGGDHALPRFTGSVAVPQIVLVPSDLSDEGRPAVEFAFELARRLPIEIHLLHVEPEGSRTDSPAADPAEISLRWLSNYVPDDLRDRVRVAVTFGEPADEIASAAERLGASCIIMGEHTRRPLRRWFTRDTSRAVLHCAHCPVWFVPAHAA